MAEGISSIRPGDDEPGRDEGGFALIIVLWSLVLIGFIVAHLTAAGRSEIQIARNLVAAARVEAAASGALYQAIFNLSGSDPQRRWPLDGRPREIALGDARATVWPEDESMRINPNLASPALLAGLLRATGSGSQGARQVTAAIEDWIGKPIAGRPREAVLAEYRAAGRDYGPPGAPLESLDELGRVLGMTPALLGTLRPHLSLFAAPEPTAPNGDPVVAAAVAAAVSDSAAEVSAPAPEPVGARTARIVVLARGPGNASASHTTIVRFDPRLPAGYAVLAWDAAAN